MMISCAVSIDAFYIFAHIGIHNNTKCEKISFLIEILCTSYKLRQHPQCDNIHTYIHLLNTPDCSRPTIMKYSIKIYACRLRAYMIKILFGSRPVLTCKYNDSLL